MSRICQICEKGGSVVGRIIKSRSKYNPTKSSRKHPNLQWARLPDGKKVLACTRCIKKIAKSK